MASSPPTLRPSGITSSTLVIITLFSLFSFIQIQPCSGGGAPQELDRVSSLPGQPQSPPVYQFSGYITVNEESGRALFYWFFEAQTHPSERPLLLWLNGGPGCSSIGYGAAVELGPLRVKRDGTGLEFNKYAWNKEANLLFLESPVGVGFSYTNISSDLTGLEDGFVANDAYSFLVNWLKRFPQYQDHDFYIAGESYGGHYVPQLAELVYERNKEKNKYPYINLKGFIVGNPETDDYYDAKGLVDYAWSHTIVSDQVYGHVKKVCDFKLFNLTDECNDVMNIVYGEYQKIDIYNIYAPKCNTAENTPSNVDYTNNLQVKKNFARRMRISAGYDPCFSNHVEEYFNRVDVQRSFHANVTGRTEGPWKVCNDSTLNTYNFSVFSVLPIYSKLINAGLRIWVYSGDADGRVPVIGSRYCVESLDLPLKAQWQTWYHKKQDVGACGREVHTSRSRGSAKDSHVSLRQPAAVSPPVSSPNGLDHRPKLRPVHHSKTVILCCYFKSFNPLLCTVPSICRTSA